MDLPVPALLVLLSTSVSLSAQWLGYPTPGIPRTPGGKPNLSAPAPRTPDGKPDLSGVWAIHTSNSGISLAVDPKARTLPFGLGGTSNLPYRPGVAERAKNAIRTEEPITRCLPTGLVIEHTLRAEDAGARKIVQTPGLLLILFEFNSMFRQIFTDGRPLPTDPNPAWNGYSVGKWEGDTLVVESSGFKDGQWLDFGGDPLTDAAKITERFRRPDFGHLQVEMTVDDPKAYTRPFTFTLNEVLLADTELLEMICLENEKDLKHLSPHDISPNVDIGPGDPSAIK
jgi:hypothetical protein